jgi:histone acetyltransferase (RNA polymerase elongator complex component)
VLQTLTRDLETRAARGQKNLSLAFFGGTFTALQADWQSRFLDLARRFQSRGLVSHVRCSTRPDWINPDHLAWLKAQGLNMVELGVQSFSPDVLHRSERGYSGETARMACEMIDRSGLELGVQLMPGLPGSTAQSWLADVEQTRGLKPKAVRIYPCLVLRDTPLAESYHRREFRPWSLKRTIWVLGQALLIFWKEGIPVIRIGLAPEQDLITAIEAGPWHPALGQMAKSLALHAHILAALCALPESAKTGRLHMHVPKQHAADFWGHCRELAPTWQRVGFGRDQIHGWDRPFFHIALDKRETRDPSKSYP